jgi:hypothetical protein
LIIPRSQDKACDNSDYDRIVCAELPDKSTHPRALQHCDISHVAWALWGFTSLMCLHGEWGLHQGLSQDFPASNLGLHRQLPNLPATRRRQDLHPPHVNVVIENLASELRSCAPDHKCLCLSLPWKLISSRFLGVPNFTSSMMM